MKKSVLILASAALAGAAMAQSGNVTQITVIPVENDEQLSLNNGYIEDNSLRFDTDRSRVGGLINPTYPSKSYSNFVSQVLYQPQDLQDIPANAVLTGMSLNGAFVNSFYLRSSIDAAIYLQSGEGVTLDVSTPLASFTMPDEQYRVTDGKQNTMLTMGESALAFFVAKGRKHSDRWQDGLALQTYTFDTPYTYDGKGLLITQDAQIGSQSVTFNRLYHYLDLAEVAGTTPMVYRFEDEAVSHEGLYLNGELNTNDDLRNAQFQLDGGDFSANQALNYAFDYYTNDLTGSITDADGNAVVENLDDLTELGQRIQPNGSPLIALYDVNDGTWIAPDGYTLNSVNSTELTSEDGSFKFTALNHSHTYWLMAASSTAGTSWMKVNFAEGEDGQQQNMRTLDTSKEQPSQVSESESVGNDLVATIKMSLGTTTSINGVETNKAVSSVTYTNMAGQQSAAPFQGVNVKTVTYSDGTTSSAKIVR